MDFLIGHLIGDYLLQNDWMAQNKKSRTWLGELACCIHCALWTIAVMVCTGWWRAELVQFGTGLSHTWLWGTVFFTHYIFDRTKICVWMMDHLFKRPANSPFYVLVYVATDNTCHLALLWLIAKYVIKG